MARDRPKGRWRQRKPETGDRETSREHFIHKSSLLPSGPLPRKGKGERLWVEELIPPPFPSPPQHPSEPFYPPPSSGDLGPPPIIGISVQPLTHHLAQGPWSPGLKDPSNEL